MTAIQTNMYRGDLSQIVSAVRSHRRHVASLIEHLNQAGLMETRGDALGLVAKLGATLQAGADRLEGAIAEMDASIDRETPTTQENK